MTDLTSLWDYDAPAETEKRFLALLTELEENAALQAELLTQLARTQSLQGEFTKAHAYLDKAKILLKPEMPIAQIRYWLELGRTYNSAAQAELAKPLFLEALAKAKTLGEDFYAVDAAHMLAIIAAPEEALYCHQTAITLCEQSQQAKARAWLGSLLNNLGWTLHDQGKYREALEVFEKALDFRLTQGEAASIHVAQWAVARCLRSLGRVTEALELQQQLSQLGKNDGFVYEEIAECLLHLKDERASCYFAKAYQLLLQDSWLQTQPRRLERLKELGGL